MKILGTPWICGAALLAACGGGSGTTPPGVVMLVPDPPPLPCDPDGGVIPSSTCPPNLRSIFDQPCETELQVCDQRIDDGERITQLDSCICIWYPDGVKRWKCQGYGLVTTSGCPADLPTEGQSCAAGLVCAYLQPACCTSPDRFMAYRMPTCRCEQDAWRCAIEQIYSGPITICSEQSVSPLDPGKRIADLSRDEAQTWCTWAATFLTVPVPQARIEGANAIAQACMAKQLLDFGHQDLYHGYVQLYWGFLPAELCATNLLLDGCEGTVGMLDDCLISMLDMGYRRDCGPILLAPKCQRTFFQRCRGEGMPECKIPVF